MYDAENLSPLQEFFRSKWVKLVLIFDVLLILVVIGVAIFQNTKSAMIDVSIVPSTAVAKIGGHTYNNHSAYRIHPGKYTVEISAEGFVPQTMEISPERDAITRISAYLSPTDDNKNAYAKNGDASMLEQVDSEEAARISKIISISKILPLNHTERVIDADGEVSIVKDITITPKNDATCKEYYCLKVATILDKNEDTVRQLLAERGYNLDDYGVEYKVYDGGDVNIEELQKLNLEEAQ